MTTTDGMLRRRPRRRSSYRTWSDGRRVHILLRLRDRQLGRWPVSMHAATDLPPVRAAVRGYLEGRDSPMAGDPVHVEAVATRVGALRALRKIGRAAKGAVLFATAPARALGRAGIHAWKATTHLAKGAEGAAALTAYATKPLAWRPKKKGPAAPAAQPESDTEAAPEPAPEQEDAPMDETSGNPRPQARHIRQASRLLRRARVSPKAAKKVKVIAKAAAKGHPGARLAQAALVEAKKRERRALPPMATTPAAPYRSAAFPAWARGAA